MTNNLTAKLCKTNKYLSNEKREEEAKKEKKNTICHQFHSHAAPLNDMWHLLCVYLSFYDSCVFILIYQSISMTFRILGNE